MKTLEELVELGRIRLMAEEPAGGASVPAAPPEETAPAETPAEPQLTEEQKEAQADQGRRDRNAYFIERRIKEREAKEARRLAELETQFHDRIEAQAAEIAALKAARDSAPATLPEEPKAEDFETLGEYTRALVKWERQAARIEEDKARKAEQEREEKESTERQAIEAQARTVVTAKRSYDQAEREYRQTLGKDGAAAFDRASDAITPFVLDERNRPVNPDLHLALFRAGPAVVHYLGENLDVLDELVQTEDPWELTMRLGEVKARVADGGRLGRRFTKAPPPPERVGGGAPPAGERSYAEMSSKEFEERRMKEIRATRGW